MSRNVFFPYPRLKDITWGSWNINVDGKKTEKDQVSKFSDANSEIRLKISARIDQSRLEEIGNGTPSLFLSVSCAETAFNKSVNENFSFGDEGLFAETSLKFSAQEIASELTVDAAVYLPLLSEEAKQPWLSKRIIAQNRAMKIPLTEQIQGFPTSAFSFKEAHKIASPWEVQVLSTDLTDSFAQTVRLNLNSDYPLVVELVKGKSSGFIDSELQASIARTIMFAVRNLANQSSSNQAENLVKIAEEHPESIVASAHRIAREYFKKDLGSIIFMINNDPGNFEMRLNSAVGMLQGKNG